MNRETTLFVRPLEKKRNKINFKICALNVILIFLSKIAAARFSDYFNKRAHTYTRTGSSYTFTCAHTGTYTHLGTRYPSRNSQIAQTHAQAHGHSHARITKMNKQKYISAHIMYVFGIARFHLYFSITWQESEQYRVPLRANHKNGAKHVTALRGRRALRRYEVTCLTPAL